VFHLGLQEATSSMRQHIFKWSLLIEGTLKMFDTEVNLQQKRL